MRTSVGLLLLLASGTARTSAQDAPDTSVTIAGFLQQDADGWSIIVPQSVAAAGVRTFVLRVRGKADRWSRFLDRYVEASGRISPAPAGAAPRPPEIDLDRMKEVEPPGTAHQVLDRDLTLHADITLAVVPNRIAWRNAAGRPTGVSPVLFYTIENRRQAPITFVLPTNDLLCVAVTTDEGVTRWEHKTQARSPDARRFVVSRGGTYRDAVPLPEDAAAKPGRYVAQVGLCEVQGYDVTAEFVVQ